MSQRAAHSNETVDQSPGQEAAQAITAAGQTGANPAEVWQDGADVPVDEAYAKLRNEAAAARLLRAEFAPRGNASGE